MPLLIPVVAMVALLLWIALWRRLLERDYSLPVALLTAAILGAVMVRVAGLLPRLPARIAIHFTGAGAANGWTAKSPAHVQVLGLLALGTWALFDLLMLGIGFLPASAAPSRSSFRMLQVMRTVVVIALAGTQLAILVPQAEGHLPSTDWMMVPVLFLVLGVLGSVVWMVWNQMGAASPASPASPSATAGWKWGVIYCNSADSRLLVERPGGAGWTLNFARPLAWAFLAALLLLPAIAWLLRSHY